MIITNDQMFKTTENAGEHIAANVLFIHIF